MVACRQIQRVLLAAFVVSSCFVKGEDFYWGLFPEDFKWGTATSSYQIEGAWDADGKGENIWDVFAHDGGNIENGDTGDIACDSYNLFERDIELLADLEVHFYRFSLSWARILPDGTSDTINQPGIDFYNSLIDGLLANGIEPMITLYHWDLPQDLQDIGGWENEELIDHFREYSRICYEAFGDRVKWWLTFNEPWLFSYGGYGDGFHAPGLYNPGFAPYIVTHNVIRAHAESWHLYDEEYRPSQQGYVSVTLDSDWKEPLDPDNPDDVEAAERAMQFKLGWYAHPIFIDGDYPEVMKTQVALKSEQQGLEQSRLPEFTEEEKARIAGTHDFFGLNHYTTQLIEHVEQPVEDPHYILDQDLEESIDPDWPTTGSSWLRMVPWGFRNLLNWIKDEYGNQPVFITENGMSDRNSSMQDDHRIYFYREYINNVLKAIDLDGCNVVAYTAWSLMDNFEWTTGYAEKFGMHYVDFGSPERTRTPKASASAYRQLIRDNGFIEPEKTV